MDSGIPVVLVAVVVVALIAVSWYYSHVQRKKFLAWLAQKGYRLVADRDHSMDERYPSLQCLRNGSNRYAYDVFEGDWNGRAFVAFNYHYETYSTDNKGRRQTHHHHFSVLSLSSELFLKPLALRPEGIFDKIGSFFGAEDINFESAEFSRKFHVKAPERKWAYDVIHTRLMECLLSKPSFSIQMDGNVIHAYRGSRFSTEEFEQAADVLTCIMDQLPDYVRRELSTVTTA